MATSKVTYLGDLRTSSIHLQSGSEIISDAPLDNNGKGEAFSPTDTVANGLASCMFTVMGIKAREMEVDLSGSTAEVTKVMATEPRRIAEIHVTFHMLANVNDKTKIILERTGMTCPVHYSLHPDIKRVIVFNWK
ncbi:OsmC family protein [Flavobacterium phycosphaerae]|uniref:OsmC family protein n=1 Tax=Flavobacterium phycosphaerae TaxID=2697515 RepID=UPI00138B1B11|nr:OsmC family protein [Flavobacterium phycosphaerae]